MDINALINNVTTAIAQDTDTTDWCNTTYGKIHTVFENVDQRDPPGEESTPFVIVYPINKTVGQDNEFKYQSFEVDVCIYDEAKETNGNIINFLGNQRIEQFRKLVETAVANVDMVRCKIDEVEVSYDTIESYPFLFAGMLFSIRETVTLGMGSDILK